ncbi:hypothetical protein K1719_036657 [Acacia pycnantha]|nr:hypothetical protein K1719_036657 [Acacia pycnantha]
MSAKMRESDGKTLGDGRTEGDGRRKVGDGGDSRLKQEGSKGGGDHGVKGHSPFVTFQSGPSGKTSVNVDAVRGPLETKDSRLSYKDKLLCLGESGLLEPHFSAAKALSGWKNYFARSNEKQGSKEIEGVCGVGREAPNLQVNAEEYDSWCKPFMNSLIVKLLGKTVNVGFMRFRMERMWAAKGPLRVTPLSNGYFLVSFSSTEDRDHALQEGPWMIADHYVLVQRWRPNFNPWKADHQKRVAVWVRIPDLPHELYNVESIRRIGNMIGKTLKIDRTTAFFEKGGFARMCVEVDLQKPLLPGFIHFGEERRFKYEGLHLVCFTYGRYGHRMDQCAVTTQSKELGNSSSEAPSVATTAPEKTPIKGSKCDGEV